MCISRNKEPNGVFKEKLRENHFFYFLASSDVNKMENSKDCLACGETMMSLN